MRYIWLTDIHLNFLEKDARHDFYNKVKESYADGIFITGDIAEAPTVIGVISELIDATKKNVYFVLGNHDYYLGDVETVRSAVKETTINIEKFNWLPATGPISLSKDVILIGQDGWADGRFGNYTESRVVLNDSRLIDDLFNQRMLSRFKLLDKMQELADHDANMLEQNLTDVVRGNTRKVIILTHVPPFKEACLYEGQISNDDWLPFFSSKATGEVITKYANAFEKIDFLVLCGHTHSTSFYQPFVNLVVRSGRSEYYLPQISDVINI